MVKPVATFSSFSVDDGAKAKAFYQDVLGFEVKADKDMPDMLWIKLASGADVMVYPKGPGHQAASFTVLNLVVDDIDKTVDELGAGGVEFEHYTEGPVKTDAKGVARGKESGMGPDIAWFKDPAGNIIALIQDDGRKQD